MKCQWLALGQKDQRYIRMKRFDEKENKETQKNLIKIEGAEGSWYEQPDILSKYKPKDERIEKLRILSMVK